MGSALAIHKEMNQEGIAQHLVARHIDEFLNGVIDQIHPISDSIERLLNTLELGAHLQSPRFGYTYTHHGLYIGNGKVIHFGGLADGFSYAPISVTTLENFLHGNPCTVVEHEHATYSTEERIERAWTRIGEDNYSVVSNNCEHFVTWCIYGVSSSSQSEAVIQTGTFAMFKAIEKGNIVTSMIASTAFASRVIWAYTKGEITREKLFEELNHTALTTISTIYYTGFGQMLIPIPIVGTLMGAVVGFFVGNLLYRSGAITLGESKIVNAAKERKEKIEEMTNTLIPIIQKNRKDLEKYISTYFSERKEIFTEALTNLDVSLGTHNNELFIESLKSINLQYGKSLEEKTFQEMMDSNTAPMF